MMLELMTTFLILLGSTLRVSTPLIFAALGGLMCERSGVINIALEGLMLAGAFCAASASIATKSEYLGVLGGACAGLVFAFFYGIFVIELKANQIVAGTAINMLAAGITPLLSKILFSSSTSTPSLPLDMRFQSAPVWLAFLCLLAVWMGMKYTPLGLWVGFAGEHPEALDSAGVRVNRVRWFAVLASGCLAGLGGASLSLFLSSSFTRNMTAGRGFMAIAALIFGKWRPIQTGIACLLFGFSELVARGDSLG
jgi:general nucleoside transport system permease protein